MENDEIIIDLGVLFRALLKRWAFIATVTALFVIVAVTYMLKTSPVRVYESKSLLWLQQPQSVVKSSFTDTNILDTQRTNLIVNTYNNIIASPDVVAKVLEKLKESDGNALQPSPQDLVRNISTQMLKGTNILQVNVRGESPEIAKRTNDLLIESFLAKLTELAKIKFKASRAFLEERLETAKKRLDDVDYAIKTFNQSHDMSSLENEITFAMRERSWLRDSLRGKEIEKVSSQEKIDALNKRLGNAYTSTLADGFLVFYEKYLLINEETSKSVIEAWIEELDRYTKLNQQRVNELLELSQEFDELLREKNLAEKMCNTLALRLEEAKIAEESTVNNVGVISRGTLSRSPLKNKMSKRNILACAIFMGIFSSCGIVIIAELFNKKIANADDVASYLGLPVLGNIPDYDAINSKFVFLKSFAAKLGRLVWGK